MRDRDIQEIKAEINEVENLIKTLEERIAVVEKDLARIYELQEVFKKCVEVGPHGG